MSKASTIGEQSAVRTFPCFPIQELFEVYQQSPKAADFSAINKLWIPILRHLNPARCLKTDDTFKNAPWETAQKIHSRVWKERFKEMVNATKDQELIQQIRGKPMFDKLQLLAPRLEQMLKDFCKEYKTLQFIPRFFTEKSLTPSFFEHLFSHYKDPKYAYLILNFIREGKDCAPFFKLCEEKPKQFSEKGKRVFENEIFEQLFYFGIISGITIDQFVKAGFKFDRVDPSGCSFVHYFLLKKEEIMQVPSREPMQKLKEKKDYLASKANPVPMTEEMYLETLKALCAQSGEAINSRYDGKTALDIATKSHDEKEKEILKTFKAEQKETGIEVQRDGADDIKVEKDDEDDFLILNGPNNSAMEENDKDVEVADIKVEKNDEDEADFVMAKMAKET